MFTTPANVNPNANSTQSAKISQSIKPYCVPILIAFLLAISVPFIAKADYDMSTLMGLISDPVRQEILPVEAHQSDALYRSQALTVWVENSVSMAGFVSKDKQFCPESFFEYMLSLPHAIDTWMPDVVNSTFYQFNPEFAYQLTSQRKSLDDILPDYEIKHIDDITSKGFFLPIDRQQELWDREQYANALATLLNVLPTDRLNLIVTDFLEDESALNDELLRSACEHILNSNRTIHIIALDGLFSGMLTDIGHTGDIYTFNYKHAFSSPSSLKYRTDYKNVQLNMNGKAVLATEIGPERYKNHRHNRPFYIILVGTAGQCADFAEIIKSEYKNYKAENLLNQTISYHYETRAPQELTFGNHGVLSVLKSVTYEDDSLDDKSIKSEIVDKDKWIEHDAHLEYHPDGVDAYRIGLNTQNKPQKYAIRFSFKPDVENYEEYCFSDTYKALTPIVRRLVFSDTDPDPSKLNIVTLNGNNYAEYSFAEYPQGSDIFSVSTPKQDTTGIAFDLNIDLSQFDVGYYRVEIPVILTYDTSSHWVSISESDILSRNLRRSDFKLNPKSQSKATKSTIDLTRQLDQIKYAQQDHLENPVSVAYIAVDIEITDRGTIRGK